MRKQLILPLLFVISLMGFFVLNFFTGIAIDDYAYKYIISNNPIEAGHRIHTFSDLIKSQYNHYFITNGRLLANGLAQVFLITENKQWFNIANTLMFGMLQVLIFLIIGIKRKEITITIYLLSLILLWFLLPGANHTLLWLDGSLNYLWAVVLVLTFLLLHEKIVLNKISVSVYWYPIFFLIGFLAAETHEVISIGVSGALFLFYLFNWEKFRQGIATLVIGFLLGTTFIVLAPGNIVRINAGSEGEATILLTIAKRMWGFVLSTPSMISVIILLIVMVILFMYNRESLKELVQKNIILLLSIFISLGFILIVGAYQPRAFFGVSVFSIVILLSFIWRHKSFFDKTWALILIYLVTIGMIVEFSLVTQTLKENKTIFDKDEITWVNSPNKVFAFREKKLNRFVSNGLGGYDQYFWSNIVMSWYYGKEYMIFLPSDLYKNLFLSNKLIDKKNILKRKSFDIDSSPSNLYRSPISDFLVLPLNIKLSTLIERGAFVCYEPTDSISIVNLDIRQKAIKYIYGRTPPLIVNEKKPCYVLETEHGNYLYFKTPSTIPLNKLKNIKLYCNGSTTQPLLSL